MRAGAFAASLIGIIAAVQLSRPDDVDVQVAETPTTAASAPTSTTTPTPDAGAAGALTVEGDGYYPWLYPVPVGASYEEGCRTPEVEATDYLTNVHGWEVSKITVDSASSNRLVLHALPSDGFGKSVGIGSLVTLAPADLAFVSGCEPWVVVSVDLSRICGD